MKEHQHPYWNSDNFPKSSDKDIEKGRKLIAGGGNGWDKYRKHLEKVQEENK